MQIGNNQPPAAFNPAELFAGPPVLASAPEPAKMVATPSLAELQAPDEKLLADKVKQANDAMEAGDEGLQFQVHKGTGQVVVKLVDRQTHEVLREFPSEKFLDMMAKLQQVAGLNVNLTT
jgi:flagellar protein FlaG